MSSLKSCLVMEPFSKFFLSIAKTEVEETIQVMNLIDDSDTESNIELFQLLIVPPPPSLPCISRKEPKCFWLYILSDSETESELGGLDELFLERLKVKLVVNNYLLHLHLRLIT